jgi:hypothetical protein
VSESHRDFQTLFSRLRRNDQEKDHGTKAKEGGEDARDPREINRTYGERSLPALCKACAAGDAILLLPEHASTLTGIAVPTIYRWVEAGTIHYMEAGNGKLTVCIKTLLAAGTKGTEA